MAQIEDYGDKIGGAKKDLFAAYVDRLSVELRSDPEFLRSLSLTEAFPKPDYEGLAEAGVSPVCLAAICAARGDIARKPTGRSATAREMRVWMAQIEAGRRLTLRVLDGQPQGPAKDADIDAAMALHGPAIRNTFRVLKRMPADRLPDVEGMKIRSYNDNIVLCTAAHVILASTPANGDRIDDAMLAAMLRQKRKEAAAPRRRTPEQRAADMIGKVRIYGRGSDLTVALRSGGGNLVFAEGLPNLKAARVWFAEHKAEMIATVLGTMGARTERTGLYRERSGPARRDGDVTPAELANRFGLRGIEFGNYVEGPRRQKDLNDMCDGFADLAHALNVPERIVGYDGALAVAFGARGNGHAAAHYERDRRVFNLTKSSGAGSAAHEWAHSADNAATMRDSTDKGERAMSMLSCRPDGPIAELAGVWGGYAGRMSALDVSRASPYWSKPEEMFARCFESWLVTRLGEDGIVNDHLVEIDGRSDVYPTSDEMSRIAPAMEALLANMTRKLLLDANMERGDRPVSGPETAPVEAPAATPPAQGRSIDDYDDREPEFEF